MPVKYETAKIGVALFDLKQDVEETTDVADQHPEVVKRLEGYAEQARQELGDRLTKRQGTGIRPAGKL